MIGIPIALLASNATEWIIHKYVLHGQGRNKRSFWSFHWHEHHKEAHAHEMVDPNYERSVFGWHAQGKEAFALAAMSVLYLPLFPIAPFFTATAIYAGVNYYRVHKRAHQDPQWARTNLPWHVDHHLGPNQHANWCVTKPWFDILMGTREPYIGTEREARDVERRAARRAAVARRAISPSTSAEPMFVEEETTDVTREAIPA